MSVYGVASHSYHSRIITYSNTNTRTPGTTELTIVGYHEYPEQIYTLLQNLKSGGASICESSHYFLRLVGSFLPTKENPRRPLEALNSAFEELERIESAKKELGWVRGVRARKGSIEQQQQQQQQHSNIIQVRLTKLLTEDRIEHYMKDIKEEFGSTEFIDAYFKAATVCSRATEKKLSMMESENQSSAEDVRIFIRARSARISIISHFH